MGMNEELDTILDKAEEVPGCVLKVAKGRQQVYAKAAGFRQIAPLQLPMTMNTVFDIASLTKIVTSTMILRLISKGDFQLHTHLDELLGEQNAVLQAHFKEISIFQLLTHSSGLLNWHPFYTNRQDLFSQLTKFESYVFCKENVGYSDLNFILLGKVIEKTTGEPLEQAFNRLIKEPLNLKTMAYGPVDQGNVAATEFGNQIEMNMCEERRLSFDNWRNTNEPLCGEVNDGNTHYFFNGVSSHAGLFADIEDVCKIGGIYTEPDLAEKAGIDAKFIEAAGTNLVGNRGLGFEFSSVFPEGFGHTGFTGTSMFIHHPTKAVAILLTNRLHQTIPGNINALRTAVHETVCRYQMTT
ncbi:serine hydrolase [Alkalihalobacillus sp. TS-13]|uniref:serine hydrolase domain-containing protein n=1 Tax=Alkalihalobacillus sp. TS-13 TaxID=2842455 RepID=UPI001C86C2AD|nr:serine hydrolase domain-containing protein [Alkalihalobacillus sp. TS-13]